MNISIKKLNELAIIPTRGSEHAAGHDLYATEEYTLKPLERKLFKTGISMAITEGMYGRIAPRSGLAYKAGIDVMAGVIDEDYRGDVGVILINLGNTCYFNSALQCILRIKKLVTYFANNSHIQDINVDNVLGSEGHLAFSFG